MWLLKKSVFPLPMRQNITTVKRSGSNFFYSLIHCFVFAAAAPSIHSFSKFARPLLISLSLDRWATKEGLTLNAVIATSDRQILHSPPWINNTRLEVNSLSVKRGGKKGHEVSPDSRVKRRAVSWVSLVVPLHDLFANRCGAGEAQLADVRVVGQTLPHHATCRKEGDWEGWL